MRHRTMIPAVLTAVLACASCTTSASNLSHSVDVRMGDNDCTGFVADAHTVVTTSDCTHGPLRAAAVVVDGNTYTPAVSYGADPYPAVWEPAAAGIALIHLDRPIKGVRPLPADAVSADAPSDGLVVAGGASFSIDTVESRPWSHRAVAMPKQVRPGTPVLTTAGDIIGVTARPVDGDTVELFDDNTLTWIASLTE